MKYVICYRLHATNANGGHTTGKRTVNRLNVLDAIDALSKIIGPYAPTRITLIAFGKADSICLKCYHRPKDKEEQLRMAVFGQCDTCAVEHNTTAREEA